MASPSLTAAQIAAIQAAFQPQMVNSGEGSTSMGPPPSSVVVDGQVYAPGPNGGWYAWADNPAWDANNAGAGYNGTPYTVYDASGNPTGATGNLSVKDDWSTNPMLPFALVAAGMAPELMASMGGGAAGTVGGIDSANGVLNNVVMNGVGGAGAAGAGAAGIGAADGGWGLTNAVVNGGAGTDLAGLGAAGTGATLLPGAATAGLETMAPLSMNGLAPLSTAAIPSAISASGLPSWLGPAATAAGALAGSQGIQQNQSSQSRMDPRMDSFVYGANGQPGLLNYAQQMLAQGMSPQGQAGWQSIMSKGMGLMNQPVAQNGFGLFTGNRYGG